MFKEAIRGIIVELNKVLNLCRPKSGYKHSIFLLQTLDNARIQRKEDQFSLLQLLIASSWTKSIPFFPESKEFSDTDKGRMLSKHRKELVLLTKALWKVWWLE